MTDVRFYEDSIAFDNDDPDFKITENTKSVSSRQSYSTDCLPNMSCGVIEQTTFYPSNNWVLRGESVESLVTLDCHYDSRFDSMSQVDPNYHGHINESSLTLEDIRSQFNSCNSCGVSWSDEHVSLDCKECGGYSLTRPCPLCDGKCKAEWTRDVSMSHHVGKDKWEGECRLPKENVPSIPAFLAEDVLIQGIQELSSS